MKQSKIHDYGGGVLSLRSTIKKDKYTYIVSYSVGNQKWALWLMLGSRAGGLGGSHPRREGHFFLYICSSFELFY